MKTPVKASKKTPTASAVHPVVMPDAVGYVTYDVRVDCPHCGKKLYLNQFPYNDDQTEYSLSEDALGLALFGTTSAPAQWNSLVVEFTCCGCRKQFRLSQLEI